MATKHHLFSEDEEDYCFQPKKKTAVNAMNLFEDEKVTSEEEEVNSEGNPDDDISVEDEEASELDEGSEDDASEKSCEEDDGGDSEDSSNEEVNVQLGEDQNRVFEYIKKLLVDKKFRKKNPKIILVNGPAGTGKTELLKHVSDYVRSELRSHAICTASTGVAAQKFKEGRTAHSMFGFPFDVHGLTQFCNINDYDHQVSGTSVIIFDDVNMTDNRLIQILNRSLQKLMNTDEMFGGKIIIFAADFLSVGPIVVNELTKCEFSIKHLSILNQDNTKFFSLINPFRTKKDTDYYEYLLEVGYDNFPHMMNGDDLYYVPLKDIKYSTRIDEMIEFVYSAQILSDPDLCAKRGILTPTSRNAKEINRKITEKIGIKTKIIKPIVTFENFKTIEDVLEDIDEDKVFPDADLELWKGCVCMITQNMYHPSTFYYTTLLNGAKVIVHDIQPDIIHVRRSGKKEIIPIERKWFSSRSMGAWKQFPLKLGYATTIHRSQGQTLDKVGVDLREPVFCHGQLYLALSRIRHSEDLMVCIKKQWKIHDVAYAANVVDNKLVRPILV